MRHCAQTRAAGQRSATLHMIGPAPGLRAAGATALHLRDLRPGPDQCFDHRGLLHGSSPKNVGPAIARLAAVIARNVPSLRADALRSKSLIYRASSVPTPRTSFGISNIRLGPVRKPEHCMATRTDRPRLPVPQARDTSPKKKPATRAGFSATGSAREGRQGFHPSINRSLPLQAPQALIWLSALSWAAAECPSAPQKSPHPCHRS